jgi:hypothetical protein
MSRAPDVIYLQWEGGDRRDLETMTDKERNTPPSRGDITWREDQIFDSDVKYVRAKKQK